jgi:hypothetical protein
MVSAQTPLRRLCVENMEVTRCLFSVTILILFIGLVTTGCGKHGREAADAHKPTAAERRGLAVAVHAWGGYSTLRSVSISTVHRAWASGIAPYPIPPEDILFHRRGDRWDIVYIAEKGRISDGACAFAPASAMRELYGIKCPSWRALHAKKATKRESRVLLTAFVEWARKVYGSRPHYEIAGSCISRLDSSWATGTNVMSGSPGGAQWFHKQGGRWRRVARAPHAIVLSLASCGGFNAELYY